MTWADESFENDKSKLSQPYECLKRKGLTTEGIIVLEILEPAMQFVQKCPVDSRVIDDTFPTLTCPVCGTAICMFPCVEKLSSRNKKCPTCRRFEMNRLTEIVKNVKYRVNLEELRTKGSVSDSVYTKLKLEYEHRNRDSIQRIYATRAGQHEEVAESRAARIPNTRITEKDKEYMKQCRVCGAWSPRASENCRSCKNRFAQK